MGVAKDSKEEMQIFSYHQILDKLDALIYITDIETDEILYMSPGMAGMLENISKRDVRALSILSHSQAEKARGTQ